MTITVSVFEFKFWLYLSSTCFL